MSVWSWLGKAGRHRTPRGEGPREEGTGLNVASCLYLCPCHLEESKSLTSSGKYRDISYDAEWRLSGEADYGHIRIRII